MRLRRNNVVTTFESKDPEIGRWLWVMQDTRQRAMEELETVVVKR